MSKGTYERLSRYCTEANVSRSQTITKLINEYLDQQAEQPCTYEPKRCVLGYDHPGFCRFK